MREILEINGNTVDFCTCAPDNLNAHLICLWFLPLLLLKIEIIPLSKSCYFSDQNLRSYESHIKYLTHFLDIRHSLLEILLAPLCALGDRTQMNSIIWANMASGFQWIQLLGGASSDRGWKERTVKVFIPLTLSLPFYDLAKAACSLRPECLSDRLQSSSKHPSLNASGLQVITASPMHLPPLFCFP